MLLAHPIPALPRPALPAALANLWIQDVRDTLEKNVEALRCLNGPARANKLVDLNVMRQVFNVCTSPVVQQAWDAGHQLAVHGLVYSLHDGLLKTIYSEWHSRCATPWPLPPCTSTLPTQHAARLQVQAFLSCT